MSKYNGWSNKATWKVSLWCESKEDVMILRDNLEETLESLPTPCIDIFQEALSMINWEELLDKFSS